MAKIHGSALISAIAEMRMLGDPNYIQRMVIDISLDRVRLHVQYVGDESILKVIEAFGDTDVEIVREAGSEPADSPAQQGELVNHWLAKIAEAKTIDELIEIRHTARVNGEYLPSVVMAWHGRYRDLLPKGMFGC